MFHKVRDVIRERFVISVLEEFLWFTAFYTSMGLLLFVSMERVEEEEHNVYMVFWCVYGLSAWFFSIWGGLWHANLVLNKQEIYELTIFINICMYLFVSFLTFDSKF